METNAPRLSESPDINIDPNFWGPHVWATIHTLALKADAQNEITAFNNFADSLQFLLPCNTCKDDFLKWLNVNGYARVREAFKWSVTLHNYVNTKLGKPTMDFETARAQYLSDNCSFKCLTKANTAVSSSNDGPNIFYIVLIIALIVAFGLGRYARSRIQYK